METFDVRRVRDANKRTMLASLEERRARRRLRIEKESQDKEKEESDEEEVRTSTAKQSLTKRCLKPASTGRHDVQKTNYLNPSRPTTRSSRKII
ncbi:hypothetical protein J6590_037120 [Homalodisca vitripennis]|nr:hypothetical protein J6590_037120 [Homalodisca vitripennis]